MFCDRTYVLSYWDSLLIDDGLLLSSLNIFSI